MYAELREAWQELTEPGGQFEIVEVPVQGAMTRTYKNAPGSVRDLWLASAAHAERGKGSEKHSPPEPLVPRPSSLAQNWAPACRSPGQV